MAERWHLISEKWPLHALVWVFDPVMHRPVLAKCEDGIHWFGPPQHARPLNPTHWRHLDVPPDPH